MNMLFEIFTDKNNPAQMWSAHTIKHLSSVKVDAVMICLITDWINTLIEICIDKKKKNRAQLSVNYTIKHLSSWCLYCNDTYS